MLTSQLYNPNGQLVGSAQLGTDGELGGLFSALKSVGSSVGGAFKGVASVAGGAAAAGGVASKIVGKTAYQAAKAGVGAVSSAAKLGCKVVNNSATQQGADLATKYGQYVPKYGQAAQGAGYALKAAGGLCNMAYPKKTTPTRPAVAVHKMAQVKAAVPAAAVPMAPAVPAAAPMVPAAAPAAHPPGSFAWFDSKIRMWKIATPRAAMMQTPAGLGAPPAMPPGLVHHPHRPQYTYGLWPGVVAAEHPYLAAYTRGGMVLSQAADDYVVTTSPTLPEGMPTVSQKEGEGRTKTAPWYKTYKLGLVLGAVGLVGAGATYAVVRRRRTT